MAPAAASLNEMRWDVGAAAGAAVQCNRSRTMPVRISITAATSSLIAR
jgi:hypothetical protein